MYLCSSILQIVAKRKFKSAICRTGGAGADVVKRSRKGGCCFFGKNGDSQTSAETPRKNVKNFRHVPTFDGVSSVARWYVYFHTKSPNLGIQFGGPWNKKWWYILLLFGMYILLSFGTFYKCPLGTFCGQLVYVCPIGLVALRKIWQPWE
jgi:hypothetical protein